MNDPEVRQLRYFVAVAEELHFGRAAQRLGMAQPPLSRAIRHLEHDLGVRLLERTTRQVTLTPAGQVLLDDARIALDAITAAAQRARNAGRREPMLRVALKADYDGGLLPQILAAYRDDPAALPVDLVMGGPGDQLRALREGNADVALLPHPFDTRGLDVEPLVTEPRMVALPAADPLAARTSLCLADLAGWTLPDGTPAERDGQLVRPASVGSPPRRLDLAQLLSHIELGTFVWFPPVTIVRSHPRPGIAYRPVSDLPPLELALAWPRHSRSLAVGAFVRTATLIAATSSEVPAVNGEDLTRQAP
ncbi:LysR family transcriptional regulator [Rugosimonospora acidiphila]|uniref:LysR family transcriptional regulator n=1 Tax=Rugosimonospora acidiphila TaxID=556531 RepID=A0ABP9RNU9_9ACTN